MTFSLSDWHYSLHLGWSVSCNPVWSSKTKSIPAPYGLTLSALWGDNVHHRIDFCRPCQLSRFPSTRVVVLWVNVLHTIHIAWVPGRSRGRYIAGGIWLLLKCVVGFIWHVKYNWFVWVPAACHKQLGRWVPLHVKYKWVVGSIACYIQLSR